MSNASERIAGSINGRVAAQGRWLFYLLPVLFCLLVVATEADCQEKHAELSKPQSAKTIARSDLRPGDVLLYRFNPPPWELPDWFVDELIVTLDGGTYNHASIYDGSKVVEAIGSGIKSRALKDSIANAEHVDVWRLGDGKGGQLGDPGFDAEPVTDWVRNFAAADGRYAYDKLLLLAGIAVTRNLPRSAPRELLLLVLERATLLLDHLIAQKNVQMICSELVYRCYLGASKDKNDSRYLLKVPKYLDVLASISGPLQVDAVEFGTTYKEAKKNDPYPLEPGPLPDFVTPHDLERSNLRPVGRLK